MNALKAIALATLLSLVYGCSHPIEIVGEGDVLSATGTRNCYYEDYLAGAESCSKNLVVHEYKETYYAVAREGWEFEQWLNYSHCADSGNECAFDIPAEAVKTGWLQTVSPLVAVFAKEAPPPPEPVAMYSYQLDAAGGLLNPQPLEGAHIQRRTVYFSFTGEYSKVNFWCCKVADGDEPHMPKVADATAPFVLRVDTGALPDDGSLQRELYADLFDSSGNYTGHYANWTLEALADSPVVFDDGGVHTIDYTVTQDVLVAGEGTMLNVYPGANIGRLTIRARATSNIYGGTIDNISNDTFSSLNVADGTIDHIESIVGSTAYISGGEIGGLSSENANLFISGGTFLGYVTFIAMLPSPPVSLVITGGVFLEGITCFSDGSGPYVGYFPCEYF
jgi:hypothetical protein